MLEDEISLENVCPLKDDIYELMKYVPLSCMPTNSVRM
jgi:hypothetical protein